MLAELKVSRRAKLEIFCEMCVKSKFRGNCFQGLSQVRYICVLLRGEPMSFVASPLPHGLWGIHNMTSQVTAEVTSMSSK